MRCRQKSYSGKKIWKGISKLIRAGKILSPLAISIIYIVFAALWIVYSDRVVLLFFENIEDVTFFQTLKGLFYVLISGALIFWLIKTYQKMLSLETEFSTKIAEHSPLAIVLLDRDANTKYINDQGAELIGVKRSDILGNTLTEMPYTTYHVDGTILQPEETFHARILKTGEIIQNERYMLKLTDGSVKFVSGSAAPILDSDGNIESVILIVSDKTEKIKSEERLKEQEKRYRLLVNESPFAIGIYQHGKVVYVNPAACSLLEGSSEELLNRKFDEIVAPDIRDTVKKRSSDLLNGIDNIYPVAEKYITLKGNIVPVEVYATRFIFNGEPAVQVIAMDITERLEREEILRKTLAEKEIVISEMHHRVKNNMAIISGLIQMQTFTSKDESVNDVLYDAVRRIQSIAMIHEELYKAQDLHNIPFHKHIRNLITNISRDFDDVNVKVSYEMDDIQINVNQAVPCALFVNEAITNVYRHAFDKGQEGELKVQFKLEEESVSLVFHDSGKGISEESLKPGSTSFGVHLLQITAEQLHGKLDIQNESGARIHLTFGRQNKHKGSSANLVN